MSNNTPALRSGVGVQILKALGLPAACALAVLLLPAPGARAQDNPGAARPSNITVVLDENYPPYVFRNDSGQLQGILVDEWRAWERNTGIRADLVAMNWEQAQQYMREGRADVIDTMFLTEERAKIYSFGKPYVTIDSPVFVNRDLGGIRDFESLRGFTVGVKAGGSVIGVLRAHGVTGIKEYPSYKDIILAARNREIQVFSVDTPPAMYYLFKYRMASDFRQAFVVDTGEFHRAVKKGDEQLLRLVEEGFAAIPESTHLVIEHRWLGAPLASRETMQAVLLALAGIAALALLFAAFALLLRRRVRDKTAELSAVVENLRSSEERFRTIFNSVSDLIFIHSWPDGRLVDANQRACEALGYTREGLLRLSVEELSAGGPPFDEASLLELMRKAYEGAPQMAEWLVKTRDNRLLWVEASIRRALMLGRVHILVSARDITERKQVEAALKKSEEFNSTIIESSPSGIEVLDARGQVVFANGSALKLLGLAAPSMLLGRRFENFWQGPDRESLLQALQEARDGRVGFFTGELRTADGGLRLLDVHLTPLGGDLLHRFLVISHDVTARTRAESALRENRRLLESILNTLPQSVFWKNGAGVYLGCNRAFAQIAGAENPQDFVGKTDTDLPWLPEETAACRTADRQVMDSGEALLDYVVPLRQKDGRRVRMLISKLPLLDAAGRPAGVIGILENIALRKQVLERLEQDGQAAGEPGG